MPDWQRQAAAIPYRDGSFCMVTARSGRRWVFPKGRIDPGHTPGEAAILEAWEEAGVVGHLDPEPIGAYVYAKMGAEFHVLVYRLNVIETRASRPEQAARQREWLTGHDALDRIEEPGLRELVRLAFRIPNRSSYAMV